MKPNEEGIFFEEPMAEYHADAVYEVPSLSGSLAKYLIMDTPRHCWWNCARLNSKFKPQHKRNWERGSVAHQLFLESNAEIVKVDAEDYRTRDARMARDKIRAEGKTPALVAEYDELVSMRDAIREQLEAIGNPFAEGTAEVVIRWREEFTLHGKTYSVWCRARLDWLNPGSEFLYDFKSTELPADPRRWSRRAMWDQGAPYQAAMYRRGIRRLTQIGKLQMHDPDFVFVIAESKPPFCCSLVNVPSDIRVPFGGDATADSKITDAMVLWHNCWQIGDWPGYGAEIYIAEGAKPQPQPQWSPQSGIAPGEHLPSEEMPDEVYSPVKLEPKRKRR